MNSQDKIKEALHQYIDQADERMLTILQAVMEADQLEADEDLEKAIQLAEERREQVNNGSMSVSSWQEVKQRLQ
ncbi:hypothetical protein [Cesiribacter sp. SM1]|uniref:hypothetical protein n=1 Tax=Cesiribacter sp. SM1 TaxID=2861196 RepID=UPI001CD5B2C0|nr:hypothetical protein [Cesiribacter sp. SM1]